MKPCLYAMCVSKKHSELFFAICMSTSSPKMRPHLLAVKYPQHILSETTKRVMFLKNSLRASRSKHFCHPPSSTSEWNQENNAEIKDSYDTWLDQGGDRHHPGKWGKLGFPKTHENFGKETHRKPSKTSNFWVSMLIFQSVLCIFIYFRCSLLFCHVLPTSCPCFVDLR